MGLHVRDGFLTFCNTLTPIFRIGTEWYFKSLPLLDMDTPLSRSTTVFLTKQPFCFRVPYAYYIRFHGWDFLHILLGGHNISRVTPWYLNPMLLVFWLLLSSCALSILWSRYVSTFFGIVKFWGGVKVDSCIIE